MEHGASIAPRPADATHPILTAQDTIHQAWVPQPLRSPSYEQSLDLEGPSSASTSVSASSSATSFPGSAESAELKRPPRPSNAWILYRSDCIQKYRITHSEGRPKATQAELSKRFAEQWRNEPEDVKGEYERMAETAREEHAQKYPDWKFSRRQLQKPGTARRKSPTSKTTRTDDTCPSSNPTSKRARTVSAPRPSSQIVSIKHESSQEPLQAPSEMNKAGSSASAKQVSPPFPFHAEGVAPQLTLNGGRVHSSPQAPVVDVKPNVYHFPPKQTSLQPIYSIGSFPVARMHGLDDTLARRSSSAAQFFNVNRQAVPHSLDPQYSSPERSAAGLPAQYDYLLEPQPTQIVYRQTQQPWSPYEGTVMFEQPALSLPNMPFGMHLKAPHTPDIQPKLEPVDWYPVDASSNFGSAAQVPASTIPDWLQALSHVRVMRDDVAGTPLPVFLAALKQEHTYGMSVPGNSGTVSQLSSNSHSPGHPLANLPTAYTFP